MSDEPVFALDLMEPNAQVAKLPRAEATRLVYAGLALRHPAPEWLVAREVLCGDSRLDAVAVRMWGQTIIHVFEVKASRSDWLREMKHPRKAEAVLPFADHFWLAIAEKDIVRIEEVPDSWGLVVLQSNGHLRAAKAAPPLRPHLIGRDFWASMIRRAFLGSADRDREKELSDARTEGYREGEAFGRDAVSREFRRDSEMVTQAREVSAAFGWELPMLVARAAEVQAAMHDDRRRRRVKQMASDMRRMADELDGATE